MWEAGREEERLVVVLYERLDGFEIGLNHLLHERVEIDLALPAEDALGLRWIAQKQPETVISKGRNT